MRVLVAVLACAACDEQPPDNHYPPCIAHLVIGAGDLMSNHDHCGACNHACGRDDVCELGKCVANRNWALWPVPDLPLTDDHYEIHKDTVVDLTTELEWQRQASSKRVPWRDTKAYCEKLTLAGGGWRLPKVIELVSIVDYTRILPAINTAAFPDTPSAEFKYDSWRLEAGGVPSDDASDQIDFSEGTDVYYPPGVDNYNGVLDHFVRCVRGGPPRKPMGNHYELSDSNDTVVDTKTGLRWARNASSECTTTDCPAENQIYTYDDAVKFCDDLVLDAYDDFRVPSVLELYTTVCNVRGWGEAAGKECGGGVMVDHVFPEWNDLDDYFYSSTQYARSAEVGKPWPWVIVFRVGLVERDLGADRVRCVRTEQ